MCDLIYCDFKKITMIFLELIFIITAGSANYYINIVINKIFGNYISIYTGLPMSCNCMILLIFTEICICFQIKKSLE